MRDGAHCAHGTCPRARKRNHGRSRRMAASCSHLRRDRAGTAPIPVDMRAGTEADLRCDWRNGGRTVSGNIDQAVCACRPTPAPTSMPTPAPTSTPTPSPTDTPTPSPTPTYARVCMRHIMHAVGSRARMHRHARWRTLCPRHMPTRTHRHAIMGARAERQRAVHICAWDRAGTAPIPVDIRAGTEADLRCDWRNGGRTVSGNIDQAVCACRPTPAPTSMPTPAPTSTPTPSPTDTPTPSPTPTYARVCMRHIMHAVGSRARMHRHARWRTHTTSRAPRARTCTQSWALAQSGSELFKSAPGPRWDCADTGRHARRD